MLAGDDSSISQQKEEWIVETPSCCSFWGVYQTTMTTTRAYAHLSLTPHNGGGQEGFVFARWVTPLLRKRKIQEKVIFCKTSNLPDYHNHPQIKVRKIMVPFVVSLYFPFFRISGKVFCRAPWALVHVGCKGKTKKPPHLHHSPLPNPLTPHHDWGRKEGRRMYFFVSRFT